eukprot:m.600953 g.600953  ORF g.600953 m.600953 type:complete len:75 (+) comp58086_c0_seq22:463-687(+)
MALGGQNREKDSGPQEAAAASQPSTPAKPTPKADADETSGAAESANGASISVEAFEQQVQASVSCFVPCLLCVF